MRRYFNHIVTFTFLVFSVMHFFLDATLVGPVGLFVFAVLNFGVFHLDKLISDTPTVSTHLSMALLVLAITWYLPANASNMQSPAIMVALIFPGAVYYLIGLKPGIVWNLIILAIYTFFIVADTSAIVSSFPLWPTVRADRILIDYWIVFSTMLLISFFIAHVIVTQKMQLDELIKTDRLTGAMNRHGLNQELERGFNQFFRYKNIFSILLIDADHFKKVNDVHGHNIGDKVLVSLAAELKKNVRSSDIVGRWGGEEFIVILPMTPLEGAMVSAEKLRAVVENMLVTNDSDTRVPVTISIGVSTMDTAIVNTEALVSLADQALYQAKKGGRNQVVSLTALPLANT